MMNVVKKNYIIVCFEKTKPFAWKAKDKLGKVIRDCVVAGHICGPAASFW